MLGNRLENAQQLIWFYVWRAQMVAGGKIKPKDALQKGYRLGFPLTQMFHIPDGIPRSID